MTLKEVAKVLFANVAVLLFFWGAARWPLSQFLTVFTAVVCIFSKDNLVNAVGRLIVFTLALGVTRMMDNNTQTVSHHPFNWTWV